MLEKTIGGIKKKLIKNSRLICKLLAVLIIIIVINSLSLLGSYRTRLYTIASHDTFEEFIMWLPFNTLLMLIIGFFPIIFSLTINYALRRKIDFLRARVWADIAVFIIIFIGLFLPWLDFSFGVLSSA